MKWLVAIFGLFLLVVPVPAQAGPNENFPATVPISSEYAHKVLNHWIRERVIPYYMPDYTYRLGPCHGKPYIKHCKAVFKGQGKVCSGVFTVWQSELNWYTELHNYKCRRVS